MSATQSSPAARDADGACALGAYGMIGIHAFGVAAPLKEVQSRFGVDPDRVVEVAKDCWGGANDPCNDRC
jgi:hypothetical protein